MKKVDPSMLPHIQGIDPMLQNSDNVEYHFCISHEKYVKATLFQNNLNLLINSLEINEVDMLINNDSNIKSSDSVNPNPDNSRFATLSSSWVYDGGASTSTDNLKVIKLTVLISKMIPLQGLI